MLARSVVSGPVHVHELGGRGPAGQRFEPQRAGAGVQIEHACSPERALHDAEPCFAHTIRGRPHLDAVGCLETAPFEFAGDDANHPSPVFAGRQGRDPRLQRGASLPLVALQTERHIERLAEPCGGTASAHRNPMAGRSPDPSSSTNRRWFVPTRLAETARAPRTPNTGAGLPGPHGSR